MDYPSKLKALSLALIFSLSSIASSEAQNQTGEDDSSPSLSKKLIINTQKIGPFGLYQNSDDIPKKVTNTFRPSKEPELKQEKSLHDVLSALKINGVNPSKGEFIIGLNRYHLGQTLPLTKTIKVKVTKITSSSVSFENIKNQETATLSLGRRNPLQKSTNKLNNLLTPNGESTPLLQE